MLLQVSEKGLFGFLGVVLWSRVDSVWPGEWCMKLQLGVCVCVFVGEKGSLVGGDDGYVDNDERLEAVNGVCGGWCCDVLSG